MSKRIAMTAGLLVVALVLAASSCREASETVAPEGGEQIREETPEFFHLGGTRYAETVPGTNMYYVYEVRFCLAGEKETYTLREIRSLKEEGRLEDDVEFRAVWYRTNEPVPERELAPSGGGFRFTRLATQEAPPKCPPCTYWDPVDRECKTSWGSLKDCFR